MPGVLRELVLVIRVSHVLNGAVQHKVEEWVEALQDSTGLEKSPGERNEKA